MNRIRDLVQTIFAQGQSSERDTEQGKSQPSPTFTSTCTPELALFRHLTGITSELSYSAVGNKPGERQGGSNLIVAAALTAMGAGGAKRATVTVFGAINTVIAGILTFLKGSGLPGRLKYYQTEWQRIREIIEQRERDFGHPNNTLDVHMIVNEIEKLYIEVKEDLAASTPDRFAGFSTSQTDRQLTQRTPIEHASMSSTTAVLSENMKEFEAGLDSKAKKFDSDINQTSKKFSSDINQATTAVRDRKDHLSKEISTYGRE